MKIRLYSLMLMLLVAGALPAYASLTPTGSYELTLSRGTWQASKTIDVALMANHKEGVAFEQLGSTVFMEPTKDLGNTITGFTWYIKSQSVLADPANNDLLGGDGPLTIKVSGLKFAETSDVTFLPDVTHLYYNGLVDGYIRKMPIPGWSDVCNLCVLTPVRPVTVFGTDYYATPYEDTFASDVTFILPELFVPEGEIYELSFGAGFVPSSNIPEPASLLILGLGLLGFRRK